MRGIRRASWPYSVATATGMQVANARGAFATVPRMATRIPPAVQAARRQFVQDVLDRCFNGNKAAMGRRLEFLDGSLIGQWIRGDRAIHESSLASISELPEVRGAGITPPVDALQVAHALSLENAETVPSTTWEQIEMGEAQRVFRMPIDTVEMEPRVKRGTWCQFATHLANDAKPGDGVLVRDKAEKLHFRVYRAGSAGAWEAHAANENFKTLVSDLDGLTVIAVLTAVEGRWS